MKVAGFVEGHLFYPEGEAAERTHRACPNRPSQGDF